MTRITVLFCCEDSIYKTLGADCYDKRRNARNYSNDHPVVVHPPCQLWGNLSRVNYARWGGKHNRPGNDGGLFRLALYEVNRCGGVLEHPAFSYAWETYGLLKPESSKWIKSGLGWVCEVWQSAYGHKARKRTWLYYVGKTKPINPKWDRPNGTHQVGFQDQRGKSRNKPTLSKKEANATPESFARWLLKLAEHSSKE